MTMTMTMTEEVGFPTRGELLHFLFRAAGVMPEKRDLAPGFDEARRKKLQKALERLSDEDGAYPDSFGKTVGELSFLMAGYFPLIPLNLAVGDGLDELLAVYSGTLINEGTFLSKKETVRWLVADQWASAAAVFVARQITRYGLRGVAQHFPDDWAWCLPSFVGAQPVWPLAKVMHWIYAQAGLSQTQFHYPGRKADESETEQRRDLENAQNWLGGGHVPSAAALHWTFARAFERQGVGEQASALTAERASAALMTLLLARMATYVFCEIEDVFGRQFLMQTCQTFHETLQLALDDTAHVEGQIESVAEEQGLDARHPELRGEVVAWWDQQLKLRLRGASNALQGLLHEGVLTDAAVQKLAAHYGGLAVTPQLSALQRPAQHEVPPGFAEMVLEGEALARMPDLGLEQVDTYEATTAGLGVSAMLPWMASWLRFIVHYRKDEDEQAWNWISKAYEAARYSAGSRQYTIVNQYIEMAAKARKKVAFRKGVEWARYTGISIRWLRDQEPTTENLDFLMEMMRRARYSV